LNPPVIASIAFACAAGAALAGAALRALPAHHLDTDARDVVKLVMGLIATMAALVLGLLIASAQGSYSAQSDELRRIAANIVELDRLLDRYGPETGESRNLLRQAVLAAHDRIWSREGVSREALDPLSAPARADKFIESLANLSPKTDVQRFILSRVLQLSQEIGQTRSLLFEQGGAAVSLPFLVMLIFWLSVLFLGFGLLARPHATVAVAVLVGGLSVSAAILLILELNEPYRGFIQLSDAPLRSALVHIGQSAKQ
jgi:hypothetical protein